MPKTIFLTEKEMSEVESLKLRIHQEKLDILKQLLPVIINQSGLDYEKLVKKYLADK